MSVDALGHKLLLLEVEQVYLIGPRLEPVQRVETLVIILLDFIHRLWDV